MTKNKKLHPLDFEPVHSGLSPKSPANGPLAKAGKKARARINKRKEQVKWGKNKKALGIVHTQGSNQHPL